MSYQKNVAGQKFNVLAINVSTGRPITGDSVNITAKISIDSGPLASVVDTNPIELDATNAPGVYVFDLSQAETNGDVLTIVPSSTTANVEIDMLNIYTTDILAAQLDDIEGKVDDILVDTTAIDGKTSQLNFTIPNQVDANSLTGGTSPSAVADAVWDELLKGSTHNIPTSAGRRLRELAEVGLYEGASVWIDTVNGSSGTSDYENGAVNNPSNNIADATTIANSVGLSRFRIAPASSFTLASGYTGVSFIGDGLWTLVLGGQALTDTMVVNAEVTGTCTSADEPMFDCCGIGTVTLPACFVRNSRLESDITLSAAGTYHFESCMSAIAGTASPSIDFGAAVGNTSVNFRHYSGGIEVLNMGQSGTDNMSLEGDGALTINANCTGGTIAVRGNFKITDNSGGSVTIVRDDDSSNIVSIKATTDQFVFTVANQVDANALTGGGGDDAATIYTYFTTGTNQDVFKADVTGIETTVNTINTNLSPGGYPFIYIEQIWENVYEEFPGNFLGAIADSVWDELSSSHITVGTFGKLASDILVDTDATIPAQISALNDFNPALDTVATVTLVGTCTTNSDMRGTDGANTIAPVDVSSDVSAIKSKSDQMAFTVTNQIDSNALSGGISDLNLQLYDGVSFEDILINILSMTNGKIVETSSGAFDFYKQDNTTVLFTLTKSGNERNRS